MIDIELNKSLQDRFAPEGSDLRKAQIRMLEMMQYIDKICRDNDIDYWLDSGTLLGAVRHNGFIPWDDDVDICIQLKDEKRLKKAIRSNPHVFFVLQDHNTDKNHWRRWFTIRDLGSEYIQDSVFHNMQKFKGLQVDIFLFEDCVSHPLWKVSSIMYQIKLRLVQRQWTFLAEIFRHTEVAINDFFRFFSRLFAIHKNDLHKVYGQVFDHYVPKDVVFPLRDYNFEGCKFKGPNDFDYYLREYYGVNYMEIPEDQEIAKYSHNVRIKFL